jgi:hypothetical protein
MHREVFRHFCLSFTLWAAKVRTHSNTEKIIHVSRVNEFLKCHRNVTNQTNPLQADNLYTNKSVVILEASKKKYDHTVCQNSSSKCEKFLKILGQHGE